MFNKNKKDLMKEVKKENVSFEEMEKAEEFGDGWFIAGVATGVAAGVAIVVLT